MTRLGLGCVKLGTVAAGRGRRASIRLVHEALDRGIAFFDTADAYGSGASEHLLGQALRRRRDGVTLATKGGFLFIERSTMQRRARTIAAPAVRLARRLRLPGVEQKATTAPSSAYQNQDFSPAYLTTALEGSLRRLRTDHIDVYQLHGPQAADREAVAEWGSKMIASGKLGRLGVGAESAEQALDWLGCDAVSAVQLPFGVLDPEAGDEAIPALHLAGKAVYARGVLGAGLIAATPPVWLDPRKSAALRDLRALSAHSGVGVVDLAMAYARGRDDIDVIVAGASSSEHLNELVQAGLAPLPSLAVQQAIQRIAAAHQLS